MIPTSIIKVDSIPINANGKVDRKALESIETIIEEEKNNEYPVSETELKLEALWKNVLGIEGRIDVNADFYEIGGNSLNASVIVSKIKREFKCDLSLQIFFSICNIKELGEYLENNSLNEEAESYAPIKKVEKREYYPLSSAQSRIFILQTYYKKSTNYNASIKMRIKGKFDIEKCEEIFSKIIERHDSIRSNYKIVDSLPVQVINDEYDFKVDYKTCNQDDLDRIITDAIRLFNLEKDLLMRVCVIKIENCEEYVMIIDMHHIIADGVTMEIITREFIELYKGVELKENIIQYTDYAVWQNNLKQINFYKKQEEYWLDKMSGKLPVINLPIDYARPEIKSDEGSRLYFKAERELTHFVKDLAKEYNATTFMVLLATLNILLYKYSNQEDIIIGTATANRPVPELENMVGVFYNTVAIRNKFNGKIKFNDFLKEVRNNAIEVYDNQDYPFEALVENIGAERDVSRSPVFDVLFISQNMKLNKTKIGDTNIIPYESESRTAKFDLFLEAWESDDVIDLNFEYCTKLFERTTIENISKDFIRVLEEIKADRNRSIEEIISFNTEVIAKDNIKKSIKITEKDIECFSNISHDYSPLHVNKEYSRKTAFGGCIAHGILVAVKAIEAYFGKCENKAIELENINIVFINAVKPEEEYELQCKVINYNEVTIIIRNNFESLCEIKLNYKIVDKEDSCTLEDIEVSHEVMNIEVEKLAGFEESGTYSISEKYMNDEWKRKVPLLKNQLQILLWSSWFIGMRAPGKQALYSNLNIDFNNDCNYSGFLNYSIKSENILDDFGLVSFIGEITNGEKLIAKVEIGSFIRPESITIAMEEIKSLYRDNAIMRFAGKTVMITGAARGLGACIAMIMAYEGASVIINYRGNDEEAEKVKNNILEFGGKAVTIKADLTNAQEVEKLYAESKKAFKKIDLVINNASPYINRQSFADLDSEELKCGISNTIGMVINVYKSFYKELKENKGTMITISSDFVNKPEKGYIGYIAAKSAIESIIKGLALEDEDINQVVVRPTRFLSDQTNTNTGRKYLQRAGVVAESIINRVYESSNSQDKNYFVYDIDSQKNEMDILKKSISDKTTNVAVASTFVADLVEKSIVNIANEFNVKMDVKFAQYNQVFQQLLDRDSLINANNGINVILLRFEDLIRNDMSSDKEKISKLYGYLDDFTELLNNKENPYFIGIFKISSTAGYSNDVKQALLSVNEQLKAKIQKLNNVYELDLEVIEDLYDIKEVFDDKRDKEVHIPFTDEYFASMGAVIVRKILALNNNKYKVIVVDCDNTLWEGISDEGGNDNIKVTEPYRYLQKFLYKKYEEGMILAVCSKNSENVILDIFDTNKDLILKKENFVRMKVNWNSKSQNIRDLAKELNLGLSSFIFIDDSKLECAEVSKEIPEVLVLQIPEDSNDIPLFLQHVWAFDRLNVTSEDLKRSQMYNEEIKRNEVKERSYSMEAFLMELNLSVDIIPIKEEDIVRVSQLTFRTNQFNLSTRRRTEEEIRELLNDEQYVLWKANVNDKFGEYGTTGFIIGKISGSELFLDSMMLSCRVLGRKVEYAVIYYILNYCREKGYKSIKAEYRPSEVNGIFEKFLIESGWSLGDKTVDGYIYEIESSNEIKVSEFISINKEKHNKDLSSKEDIKDLGYLHHIAIAVSDYDKAHNYIKKIGYVCEGYSDEKIQNSILAIYTHYKYQCIELVAPVDENSPVNMIISKNGDVPYHLCYKVKDSNEFLEYLKSRGIQFEVISDLKEVNIFNKKKVMFIYVKSVGLIELLEDGDYKDLGNALDNTVVSYIVFDSEETIKFFESLGYVKEYEMDKDYEREIQLYKTGSSKIKLIVPDSNDNYKQDFLNINGSCIYKVCLNDFEESIIFNNLKGNHEVIMEEDNKYTVSEFDYLEFNTRIQSYKNTRTSWNILKNNVHSGQVFALKNNTAKKLIDFIENERAKNTVILKEMVHVKPRNEIEEKIKNIWEDVLKIKNIGIDDNFFKIGGHSLGLVQINSKIQEQFNKEIPIVKMFQYTTVSALAEFIGNEEKDVEIKDTAKHNNLNKGSTVVKNTVSQMRRKRGVANGRKL